MIFNNKENKEIKDLKMYIKNKNMIENRYINSQLMPEFNFIAKEMKNFKFKGIIVYPEAIMWEPIQRPQQLLKEFAKKGYLCFFCEPNPKDDYIIKEVEKNLYLVNGQEKLLPLIKDKEIIFYISYFLQYIYSIFINNKIIWLDVLDRLDFFDRYNKFSKKIWKKLIKNADIITYTATNLKSYIKDRNDAILISNAANVDDFIVRDKYIPNDIKPVLKLNKIIIGYFGAIENWFDISLIEKINNYDKYSVVLIGNVNQEFIDKKNMTNVYFLGAKDYKELKNYTKYFDIGIIPFIVNDLTNNVSPVKFFEYIAAGLPVISTPIYEMKKYNTPILKLIDIKDYDNINNIIDEMLIMDKKSIKLECQKISFINTWTMRANFIEEKIKEVKLNGK
ncbi:MAG: glycosyltransferase [Bacilli bacterium]|nr:glycosyltransferase [Bacilli bacterium]MDD4406964.1 glycosyltransferase [Bacilli bacterium]